MFYFIISYCSEFNLIDSIINQKLSIHIARRRYPGDSLVSWTCQINQVNADPGLCYSFIFLFGSWLYSLDSAQLVNIYWLSHNHLRLMANSVYFFFIDCINCQVLLFCSCGLCCFLIVTLIWILNSILTLIFDLENLIWIWTWCRFSLMLQKLGVNAKTFLLALLGSFLVHLAILNSTFWQI